MCAWNFPCKYLAGFAFLLENIERFLCLDNTSYNYSNYCRYLTRGVRERHSIKGRVLESEIVNSCDETTNHSSAIARIVVLLCYSLHA